jgi:hypothetical protein
MEPARLRRPALGDTLAGVRRFVQRWSIVLLVVTRLIFGELAYSMPHDSVHAATNHASTPAAQTDQSNDGGCPDHTRAPDTDSSTGSEPEAPTAHHAGAGHDGNCCKTSCYCPCLHLSGILSALSVASLGVLPQQRPSILALGQTTERVFLLLRPPA